MEKKLVGIKETIVKLHTRINELEAEKRMLEAGIKDIEKLNYVEVELDNLRYELKKAVLKAAGLEEKLDNVDKLDITIF